MNSHQPVHRAAGANAVGSYVARPPSPPYIHVPSIASTGETTVTITPTFYAVADAGELSREDLEIITQGRQQVAQDGAHEWTYESRRQAQPVLDFLYLGPASVAKDRDFLQREGITMLLACRSVMMTDARFMSVGRVAQELNIATGYLETSDKQDLIAAVPQAVRMINDHLLDVYRRQIVPVGGAEQAMFDKTSIVAGYLMSMFGLDIVNAVQFIMAQRFCTNFDDETKNVLQSWHDILKAKRDVAAHKHSMAFSSSTEPGPNTSAVREVQLRSKGKRTVDDMMMTDADSDAAMLSGNMDEERYTDRNTFSPFIDGSTNTNTGV